MNETRLDLYREVHKGLRACMAHTLPEVGSLDTADEEDTRRVLGQVRELLELCRVHLMLEDTFLHPAMQARTPGSAATTLDDHAHHLEAFAELERAVLAVENAPAGRERAAHDLYGKLARFVADNYLHMQVEETHNNAILWANYTDAELLQLKERLLAAIAPDVKMAFMRWIAPSLTPAERADVVAAARIAMPPPAFAAVLGVLKSRLGARDWFKLQLALGPLPAGA